MSVHSAGYSLRRSRFILFWLYFALLRGVYTEFGTDPDDLSGAIKMALTVWFVSAIDLLYGFFPLCNVLPQSILDQRIQADLLRHCANRSLLVQLR